MKTMRSGFTQAAYAHEQTEEPQTYTYRFPFRPFQIPTRATAQEQIATETVSDPASEATSEILVSEVEEEVLKTLTLHLNGSDESVLDSYTQFLKRSAAVLSSEMAGKIIPRNPEVPFLPKDTTTPDHGRMLQVHDLRGDTADLFISYIQQNKPDGVVLDVNQHVRYISLFDAQPK